MTDKIEFVEYNPVRDTYEFYKQNLDFIRYFQGITEFGFLFISHYVLFNPSFSGNSFFGNLDYFLLIVSGFVILNGRKNLKKIKAFMKNYELKNMVLKKTESSCRTNK